MEHSPRRAFHFFNSHSPLERQIQTNLNPSNSPNMGFKEEVENKACRRGSARTHGKSILAKIA